MNKAAIGTIIGTAVLSLTKSIVGSKSQSTLSMKTIKYASMFLDSDEMIWGSSETIPIKIPIFFNEDGDADYNYDQLEECYRMIKNEVKAINFTDITNDFLDPKDGEVFTVNLDDDYAYERMVENESVEDFSVFCEEIDGQTYITRVRMMLYINYKKRIDGKYEEYEEYMHDKMKTHAKDNNFLFSILQKLMDNDINVENQILEYEAILRRYTDCFWQTQSDLQESVLCLIKNKNNEWIEYKREDFQTDFERIRTR